VRRVAIRAGPRSRGISILHRSARRARDQRLKRAVTFPSRPKSAVTASPGAMGSGAGRCGCDDLTGFQRNAMAGKFVCQPGERDARIAQHVRADTFAHVFAATVTIARCCARSIACQSSAAGEDKIMRAGIIGDQLRCADTGKIIEAGIRHLDCGCSVATASNTSATV